MRFDQQGAAFVEELIVILPLLLTSFSTWELAEYAAAKLVVQRASSAAGRAAVVVLPDEPSYYDGEALDSCSGLRRTDIERAAAMVLSALPRFTEDFDVSVDNIPDKGVGQIDFTVEATYDRGTVSLICGGGGVTALTATTSRAYQGAAYDQAKNANMDCGEMIDAGMLSMRRTLGELRAALDPAEDAALLGELESGFDDPDELEELEGNLRAYFQLD